MAPSTTPVAVGGWAPSVPVLRQRLFDHGASGDLLSLPLFLPPLFPRFLARIEIIALSETSKERLS
jgi:hypothetical protein